MLNHNFVNVIMGFVRWRNENRKVSGARFYSKDELMEIEKKVIRVSNAWNKFVNMLVNNKLALLFLDLKILFFGTPYPEYLYSPELNQYLAGISVKYQTKNFFLRKIKEWLNRERIETQFSVTLETQYALDTSKILFAKKNWMRKMLNKTWKLNGGKQDFVFKRIITYNKKEEDKSQPNLCSQGYDMNDGTGEAHE